MEVFGGRNVGSLGVSMLTIAPTTEADISLSFWKIIYCGTAFLAERRPLPRLGMCDTLQTHMLGPHQLNTESKMT